ncbi:class I SAM-dependent methyltransferase [Chloroflexota bacterium]
MNYLKILVKAIIPKKHHGTMLRMYFRLRAVLYIGNQVTCPCCDGHFRKFLPFGVEQRPDAQCPNCESMERHRLIWLYLKNRTNLFSDNLRVLHFAPEYIIERNLRCLPNLDYVSADLDLALAMVEMDITNIHYDENSFDVILCSHVLEHVADDEKAMRELLRVLKPGGWAILQSPIDLKRDRTFEDPKVVLPEDRKRLFGEQAHVRRYGRDYKDRLEQAGFEVKMDSYVRNLDINMIRKYGLKKDEDIYFCTKPKPEKD